MATVEAVQVYYFYSNYSKSKCIIYSGDNNGQLIMCIPGCGGTGKSQLIRALSQRWAAPTPERPMKMIGSGVSEPKK